MSQFERKLHTEAQKISLSTSEKDELRNKLERYIDFVPLRVAQRNPEKRVPMGFFESLLKRYAPAALGLTLIAGSTGVAYAAERAMPGEPLYAVKVNFNEEVVGAFTLGEKAKTDWEVRRAERRLEEAGRLARQGILTSEIQEQVVAKFAEHVEKVAEKAKEFKVVNPALAAEVSADFETALSAHETILASVTVEEGSTVKETRVLVSAVHDSVKSVAEIRESAEEVIALTFEIEDDTASSTSEISELERGEKTSFVRIARTSAEYDLAELNKAIRREKVVNADLDIEAIETEYEKARTLLKKAHEAQIDENYSVAYKGYKEVSAISRTALRYLQAQTELGLDSLPIAIPETPPVPTEQLDDETQEDIEQVMEVFEQGHDFDALREKIEASKEKALQITDIHDAKRITNMLKRAEVLHYRGELAKESGNTEGSERFYAQSEVMLQKADDNLQDYYNENNSDEQEKESEEIDGPDTGSLFVEPTDDDVTLEATSTPEYVVSLRHTFDQETNEHTFTGWIPSQHACGEVVVDGLVRESFPEQIGIIVTTDTEDVKTCEGASGEVPLEYTVEASEQAVLTTVHINDTSIDFVVVASVEEELTDVLEVLDTEEDAKEDTARESETYGYPATQELFGRMLDTVIRQREK